MNIELIERALYSPEETSTVLGVSKGTLANWRVMGKGPKYCKISGKSIRYKKTEIDNYIERSERASTSEVKQFVSDKISNQ